MKKLLFVLFYSFFFHLSMAQGESYWKTENVTRIDHKEIWGVTLSYMEMLSNMQIHLIKNGDSFIFSFPYEKQIKQSDLTSFTNCRLKESGELLDSIYAVDSQPGKLKIMFHYIGRDGENRFILNLSQMEKEAYLKEVEKLKNDRKQQLDLISPVDLSEFRISAPIPPYFKPGLNLNFLNPIQLAEDLSDIDNLRIGAGRFAIITKNGAKHEFNHHTITNSVSIGRVAAKIGNLSFDNLSIVTSPDHSKMEALTVSKKELTRKNIQDLYQLITRKMKNARIEGFGLPNQPTDDKRSLFNIAGRFGLRWIDGNNVAEIIIQTPPHLYEKKIDKNVFIESYRYEDDVPQEVILKVFNHYLSLIETSDVQIYCVSKEFSDLITSDGWSGSSPSFMRDFL